jgi:putative transposase
MHRTAPGHTFFVTTKTWQNRAMFQVSEIGDILIRAMLSYRGRGAFSLHEFVVTPDHWPLMLTPADDLSLEKCIQLIKGGASPAVPERRVGRMPLSQSSLHEQTVRDARDCQGKAMYIRTNPVHEHLAETPRDWAHGSGSGKYTLDSAPEGLKGGTSGAKAPFPTGTSLSELKLRRPKQHV